MTSLGVGTNVKPLLSTFISDAFKLSLDRFTMLSPNPSLGLVFWQVMPSCVFSFLEETQICLIDRSSGAA